MIRINLLPVKAAQKKEQLRGQLIVLLLALALAGGGCAATYYSLLSRIDSEKAQIAQKESEIQGLRKKIGEVAQFKKRQQELQGKLDVLAELKNARSGPVRLLDELSLALPEKLWLTQFKESGGSVSIDGVGMNEETVARFLRNLESSPYFNQVELQVIEQMSQDGQKLQKFALTSKVEKAAEPDRVAKR